MKISGLPRGFGTCCLRFTGDVATAHARLASGWLASLYREGVEPSGLLRKVSELLHLFPLSWFYPDATLALLRRLLSVLVAAVVVQASEKPQHLLT